MSGLPQRYDSPLHLPFNRDSLQGCFELQAPDADPGGEGYGVLLRGNRLLVLEADGWFSLPCGQWREQTSLYLGLWRGLPCRLIEWPQDQPLPDGLSAQSLMDDDPALPIELLSLGGMARMIRYWAQRSRYCGCCGLEMDWLPGEWGRCCARCDEHFFPPIHPCAIVLVRRPGQVLLTRKEIWAPGRYSLVAGFQEFGENLEETAIREVREETGVDIGNVRYVGSQCWPFPSQTMVGFVADYLGGELVVDKNELDDARWFDLKALPSLPPKRSIARYILDTALELD
ncbi:MAG: NAD(+) diphosphatase [Desulfuromonadales bacterium]|nr:NAD(+) diphosphatase [Desulfuromonadales bacterium]